MSDESAAAIFAKFSPSRRPDIKHSEMSRPRTQVPTLKFKEPPIAESSIETNLYVLAELANWVTELFAQPFTLEVDDEEGAFSYTPDALLKAYGRWVVVECKPVREYFDTKTVDRHSRIRQALVEHTLAFIVIDEIDVGGSELQDNISQLWRVRLAAELESKAYDLAKKVQQQGAATVDELLSEGFRLFEVHRALASQIVFADLCKLIGNDTVIFPADFCDPRALLWKLRPKRGMRTMPAAPDIWEPSL